MVLMNPRSGRVVDVLTRCGLWHDFHFQGQLLETGDSCNPQNLVRFSFASIHLRISFTNLNHTDMWKRQEPAEISWYGTRWFMRTIWYNIHQYTMTVRTHYNCCTILNSVFAQYLSSCFQAGFSGFVRRKSGWTCTILYMQVSRVSFWKIVVKYAFFYGQTSRLCGFILCIMCHFTWIILWDIRVIPAQPHA